MKIEVSKEALEAPVKVRGRLIKSVVPPRGGLLPEDVWLNIATGERHKLVAGKWVKEES